MVDTSISSTPTTMQPWQTDADEASVSRQRPVPALNSPNLKKECEKELVSLTQLAHHDVLNLGGFLIFSHRMQGSCEENPNKFRHW
jgi:hypothetical protein